jgi:uncharacterized protein (TIGR03435 family)
MALRRETKDAKVTTSWSPKAASTCGNRRQTLCARDPQGHGNGSERCHRLERQVRYRWSAEDAAVRRPTIEKALQDQLGPKLESKKGTLGVVVIDHIDRTPVEN